MSFTINPNNLGIQLTRGDTFGFTILDDDTGLPAVFEQTDKLTFTVRRKINDPLPLISREFTPDENGNILIKILPSDTANLNYCTGFYDIQLTQDEENIFTLVPGEGNTSRIPTFQICPEVTRPEVTP
jgi:hypothetical protein